MKTLIIGILAFLSWSAFSTHFYVCKIKGLCNEEQIAQNITGNDTSAAVINPVVASPGSLSIYFEFDKYEFIPDEMTDRYFVSSNAYMAQNPKVELLIVGHTDAVGTEEYNLNLGSLRANTIKNYFVSKGMPANKSLAESKGETEPADDNATSSGRAKNRRTIITIK
jgi:outer membrane protein OmpA-like peptidoglycan-associated protein